MNVPDQVYPPAELRDRLLNAPDAKDRSLSKRLAANLKTCGNRFPGLACEQLGLPIGNTDGTAARLILET
jgi:hypothetical protein